ncbi:hypothetical protein DFP72DRAFT_855906 [Ephemerocybe angulata]|uniref:Uncharacterized protein n=1 Tax=Ephemerocybe angulata TaxID=980116 RepID=A0A8H6HGK8_9AGAR|nr:hypothetical protein DFP72DRAFT_855906 [Tulosesus angulatus]
MYNMSTDEIMPPPVQEATSSSSATYTAEQLKEFLGRNWSTICDQGRYLVEGSETAVRSLGVADAYQDPGPPEELRRSNPGYCPRSAVNDSFLLVTFLLRYSETLIVLSLRPSPDSCVRVQLSGTGHDTEIWLGLPPSRGELLGGRMRRTDMIVAGFNLQYQCEYRRFEYDSVGPAEAPANFVQRDTIFTKIQVWGGNVVWGGIFESGGEVLEKGGNFRRVHLPNFPTPQIQPKSVA